MFLASLRKDLEKNLEQSALPSPKDKSLGNLEELSLPAIMKPVLQLPIKDRLFLVDAITASIRQELSLTSGK